MAPLLVILIIGLLALFQSGVLTTAQAAVVSPVLPGFDAPIDLRVWGKKEWALREAVVYTALDGRQFLIPAWFIHDGASIPRFARGIYGSDDELRAAALLHDWLYCSHRVSRCEADVLFLECMGRLGAHFKRQRHVFWLKRYSIYGAVRVGGLKRWAQCDTGVKSEDFAFVCMTDTERWGIKRRYGLA